MTKRIPVRAPEVKPGRQPTCPFAFRLAAGELPACSARRARPPARGAGERLRRAVRRAAVPTRHRRRDVPARDRGARRAVRSTPTAERGAAGRAGRPDARSPAVGRRSPSTARAPLPRPNGAGDRRLQSASESARREHADPGRVREPGGAWGPVTDAVPAPEFANGNSLAVAVSERGDGLVAVALQPRPRCDRVARRAPGGAFGAPETLSSTRRTGNSDAADGAGRHERLRRGGRRVVVRRAQRPAARAVGGGRRARRRLPRAGADRRGAARLALRRSRSATAGTRCSRSPPVPSCGSPSAPRAAGSVAATAVAARRVTGSAILPGAALDAAGGALVAWMRASDSELDAVVRAGPGPFGAPVTLARAARLLAARGLQEFFDAASRPGRRGRASTAESGPDAEGGYPRALISDGRALVTCRGADAPRRRVVAGAALGDAPARGRRRRDPRARRGLRDAHVADADAAAGRRARRAWADNGENEAAAGCTSPLEGAPRPRTRRPARQVRVRASACCAATNSSSCAVTCSAACEVRAQVGGGPPGPAGGSRSAARAAATAAGRPPDIGRSSPARRAGAGARALRARPVRGAATAETLTVRLRRGPGRRCPRVRRRGRAARRRRRRRDLAHEP